MEWLNSILSSLDKIQGISAVGLICLSCIVVGYVLRFIKSFPNDGIPVVVILWGAVAMLVLADPRASDMPERIWVVRNFFVGLVIGFVAWMLHKIVLTKIEEYITAKFPEATSDTTLFNAKPSDKPEEDKKP